MIRLRFITGNDWFSNIVRVVQNDGWTTHVDAVLPNDSLLGARPDGGVQIRPAGYDKKSTTQELIVELNATQEQEQAFYTFLHAQTGKPYDLEGIGGLVLNRNWHNPNAWFCSELQAAALENCAYIPPLAALNSHISPRDLLLIVSSHTKIPNMAGVTL